ncbi:amidase domain-containing protein [Enterococcus caccae]|uniref:N-acetylmuramoyl-L-alanine amidase n=1 Tax=Enterococcus caccae ATCC BAA-1240 TaxID=1158612 RepID=R3TPY9_9ENTE|nr:amidase domain-containing protein [Enterococcus caccae]EOL43604.1 N-acetylmuramoyl-L-alanine amidase [Enterococcus caccae ATCC BAA-1240]EOT67996.1 N-acetylmuramoyl-L-alanine amidase [Enterococcus caccae ATCC BAA-1240]OJG28515.1 N-acetylmuramoyl-L-alanine amidase [Enterococcus caccae]
MKSKKIKRQILVLASVLILLSLEVTPVVTLAAELPSIHLQVSSIQTTGDSDVGTTESTTSSDTTTTNISTTESSTISGSTSSSTTETTTTNTSSEPSKESTTPLESTQSVESKEQLKASETSQEPEEPEPVSEMHSAFTEGENSGGSLDFALEVEEIAPSNLNGYELPLLSSFEEKERAAVVAEALKQVGKKKQDFKQAETELTSSLVAQMIYQQLFQVDFGNTPQEQMKTGDSRSIDEAEPGDLIFWQTTGGDYSQNGVYLGQGKYLVVAPESKDKPESTVQLNNIYTTSLQQDSKENATLIVVNPFHELILTDFGKQVLAAYSASFEVKKTDQTTNFIKKISETARELGKKYDVFASVMIAQAILESGSGSSQLGREPYYNLFGVKGSFQGNSVIFPTKEVDQAGHSYTISAGFRDYSGYQDSLQDYVQLLRQGIEGNEDFYKPAWRSEAKNYLQATSFLTGKYATDTQYNNKLNSLIAVYHLTQFDLPKVVDGLVIQAKNELPEEYQKQMDFPVYDGINYNQSGSYPVGQCTWYVYNRLKQLGVPVDDFMGNGGDWGSKGIALGYQVSALPKAGRAISFQPGVAGADSQYGHVAFVEAVTSEGIIISESNVVNDQTISYRVLPNAVAYSSGVTYIGS